MAQIAMTRGELIEKISRQIHGGFAPTDSQITDALINSYISDAIAAVTVKNYRESIEVDNIESIGDAFYSSFKGIPIAKDNDTGYFYSTLPSQPVSLPRGLGIANVTFSGLTGSTASAVGIKPHEIDFLDIMPANPNKVLFWCEGTKIWMKSPFDLLGKTLRVRMVAPYETDSTAILTLPPEYVMDVINIVTANLLKEIQIPKDVSNDGINVK